MEQKREKNNCFTRRVRRDGIHVEGFRYFSVSLIPFVGTIVTIHERDNRIIVSHGSGPRICEFAVVTPS